MKLVVKIGSSSLTDSSGRLDTATLLKLCGEVATLVSEGNSVVVVSSAATAMGLHNMGFDLDNKPNDPEVLSAAAAVGQISLTTAYQASFGALGVQAAQILLSPTDFLHRRRYLKSRSVIKILFDQNVVTIVNENDALADSEFSFGDNDNLAALVCHLVDADRLILLTDIEGFYSANPATDPNATLIKRIEEITPEVEAAATGSSSKVGRGGMASKISAVRIATMSGVEAVIASATADKVISTAALGNSSVGTTFTPSANTISARKLWIGYAAGAKGNIVVDEGAKEAIARRSKSLLCPGIQGVEGKFLANDVVEISTQDGGVFAKGIARWAQKQISNNLGVDAKNIQGLPDSVVHTDDLIVISNI